MQRRMERVAEQRMLRRSLVSMEDRRDGYNYHCGGRSYGGSGKEQEEFSMSLLGEDDKHGENWFK